MSSEASWQRGFNDELASSAQRRLRTAGTALGVVSGWEEGSNGGRRVRSRTGWTGAFAVPDDANTLTTSSPCSRADQLLTRSETGADGGTAVTGSEMRRTHRGATRRTPRAGLEAQAAAAFLLLRSIGRGR